MTEQQQQRSSSEQNGEKNDENEKYVIYEKEEGQQKDEYDEDGDKRDDSEKVLRTDKKITCEKLPPGWEKHEGNALAVIICHKVLLIDWFFYNFDR